MALFTYKAINQAGSTYEDSIEAPDSFAVYRKIKSEGGTVVFVAEAKSGSVSFVRGILGRFGKVKMPEKIAFARNLGSMIEAGLPMTRAISVMEKQTRNKKLKAVLEKLNEDVSKGENLSESMKRMPGVFSSLFISMVKAGEESGNLAGSLKLVALQMEKSHAIVKKVKGAMLYPAIIISIMLVIGVLMMIYMVPTLTETFKGLNVELPRSTRIIIAISDFLRNHYFLVFVGVIMLGFLGFLGLRSSKGKRMLDFVATRIPVIGNIVKEVNAARTARTLSSLLSSGVDIIVALGATRDVLQNSYYREVLETAQAGIQKGEPISSVFIQKDALYPVFLGEMMSVGEETGKMADMLLGVAVFYEDEVDQATKDMSTIIEPILMVLIGIGVGIFAIAMLAPTYSLVERI